MVQSNFHDQAFPYDFQNESFDHQVNKKRPTWHIWGSKWKWASQNAQFRQPKNNPAWPGFTEYKCTKLQFMQQRRTDKHTLGQNAKPLCRQHIKLQKIFFIGDAICRSVIEPAQSSGESCCNRILCSYVTIKYLSPVQKCNPLAFSISYKIFIWNR